MLFDHYILPGAFEVGLITCRTEALGLTARAGVTQADKGEPAEKSGIDNELSISLRN